MGWVLWLWFFFFWPTQTLWAQNLGGGGAGDDPHPLRLEPSLPTSNTNVLSHQATKNVANPKMTKWQKILKFKWSPYFWLGGSKNSSGRGELLGYDMFQAEQNLVFLLTFFKFSMYFPPLCPPRIAPGAPFYLWAINKNMLGSLYSTWGSRICKVVFGTFLF